jgi:rhodanese-related sulfurtransferase
MKEGFDKVANLQGGVLRWAAVGGTLVPTAKNLE